MQARDGNFYGVTSSDTTDLSGLLYVQTASGTHTVLYTFPEGDSPTGNILQGLDGNLYGLVTSTAANVQSYVYVFNIARKTILGTYPIGLTGGDGMTQDSAGNLYGVTTEGGDNNGGTVFEVTISPSSTYPPPAPVVTTIYSFPAPPQTEVKRGVLPQASPADPGSIPSGTPIVASDGYLYGFTNAGGAEGAGAVWKLTLPGHVMSAVGPLSAVGGYSQPFGGLAEAEDGNLYGITLNSPDGSSPASLFQVNLTSNSVSLFHTYSQPDETRYVYYGTALVTYQGYVITAGPGGVNNNGAIEAVDVTDTTGGTYYDLYDFTGGLDGANPYGQPIAGFISNTEGVLIGSTSQGGSGSEGTIYGFENIGAPSITLTTDASLLEAGSPIALQWQTTNAFSESAQTCYANSSDYSFSGSVPATGSTTVTPTNPGNKSYSITCGGVETAVLNLPVSAGVIALSNGGGNLPSSTIDFGAVPEGTNATESVTLTNNGKTAFPFAISISGSKSARYSMSNNCGSSISVAGSCSITFTYSAPSVAEADPATYTVTKQGFSFTPSNTGTLTAHSVVPGTITLSATTHSFGTVSTTASQSYTFQVYNGTGATATFSLAGTQVKGSADQGSFSTTCPATLEVNQACSVTFVLSPQSTSANGPYEYDINVSSSATVKPAAKVKLTATFSIAN